MSTKVLLYKYNGKLHELMDHIYQFKKDWYQYCFRRLNLVVLEDMPKLEQDALVFETLNGKIRSQTLSMFPSVYDIWDVRGSVLVFFDRKDNIYVRAFAEGPIRTTVKTPQFLTDKFTKFVFSNSTDDENTNTEKKKSKVDYLFRNGWSYADNALSYDLMSSDCIDKLTHELMQSLKRKREHVNS